MTHNSPAQHVVHVWCVRVYEPCDRFLDVIIEVLDGWEKRRLDAFKLRDDKIRFGAAHALARIMLSKLYPEAPPTEWRLDHSPAGKPFVRVPHAAQHIHFSLSHTRDLVGCAAAVRMPVGFDLEALDENLEVEELLPHAMAKVELARWTERYRDFPVRRFLQHWTLKEALAKALGVGFAISPSSLAFEVGDDDGAKTVAIPNALGDAAAWKVYLAELMGTHVAAIAVNSGVGEAVDVRWHQLDMDTLMLALR